MARTGGYRRSGSVTPHAALQNKSVVCSGSRVTNSTVMKLRGSVNRGGITVETYTKSTCSHWYSAVKATKTIPRADGHGLHTVNGKVGGILDRLFFFMPQDLVEIQVEQPQNEDNYEEYRELFFFFFFFLISIFQHTSEQQASLKNRLYFFILPGRRYGTELHSRHNRQGRMSTECNWSHECCPPFCFVLTADLMEERRLFSPV